MRILVFFLGVSIAAAGDEPPDKPATAAERYQALAKEFSETAHGLWQATTDEEREKVALAGSTFPQRFLELAEKHPDDPAALDALVHVLIVEIWLENNTLHPGLGKDTPECRALAILSSRHPRSEKLGEACRRVAYGFRKECETFLRTVLEKSPHHEVQGLACLRLAQFLNGRRQKLELIRERPESARRFEGLFGKEYLEALARQDRARAAEVIEALFSRAAEGYGEVKLPFEGTVGERARAELYEIHHLSVGKAAKEIEGEDQDGRRFKLSDYRGKVVLLYFWSEY